MRSRANPVFLANLIVLEIIQCVKPVLSSQMLLILHLSSSLMPSFLATSCPHQAVPEVLWSSATGSVISYYPAPLVFSLGPLPSSWLGLCACVRLGKFMHACTYAKWDTEEQQASCLFPASPSPARKLCDLGKLLPAYNSAGFRELAFFLQEISQHQSDMSPLPFNLEPGAVAKGWILHPNLPSVRGMICFSWSTVKMEKG